MWLGSRRVTIQTFDRCWTRAEPSFSLNHHQPSRRVAVMLLKRSFSIKVTGSEDVLNTSLFIGAASKKLFHFFYHGLNDSSCFQKNRDPETKKARNLQFPHAFGTKKTWIKKSGPVRILHASLGFGLNPAGRKVSLASTGAFRKL